MELNFNWRFNIKELPDMGAVNQEVYNLTKDVKIGRTCFMEKYGVSSEREYKERMMKEGRIMKHSAIGLSTWQEQEEGLRKVHADLAKTGSRLDRYGACMDWVMGVPDEYKDKVQPGSGLILKTDEEWAALGQVNDIQPHLGDHMIGSLNSVNNTIRGLKAGVTTIGNFSHYYTYEYPGLDMEAYRTEDMVKAIAVMAKFREQGTIIHSNLDDGFGAQFHDLANLVGYARLERYICEDLLGARIGHCFGNLFSNPLTRIIFNVAMDMINVHKTPGSMIYGNTIGFGFNMPRNFGILSSYSMADALGQMICPTGHAITPIPTTEAIRVPTIDEIVEAHNNVDAEIEAARYYIDYIDVPKIYAEAELLVSCGNVFFERVVNALDDQNIDITHPGEMLAALKAIGAAQMEANYGVGQRRAEALRGRIPLRPTAIVQEIEKQKDGIISNVANLEERPLHGVNVVLAATDVHEFGKDISKTVLTKAGAEVFDLGTNVPVDEIADTVIETGSKAVLISTYNGIALSFARALIASLEEKGLEVPIIMGGRLNEIVEGESAPVDVSELLAGMDINVDNDIEKIVGYLTEKLEIVA